MKPMLNVALILLLLVPSCKKKDEQEKLPEASHIGANTLGFYVNGQARATTGKPNSVSAQGAEYYNWYDTTLEISGVNGNSPRFNLSFRLPWNRNIGTYPLTTKYPCEAIYIHFPDGSTIPTGTNQYKNDVTHSGQVTITYWDGNVLAGTFNMDLVNDSGEVVHITDGRFDIDKQ